MSEPSVLFLGCGQAAVMHGRTLRGIAPKMQRFYASRSGEKACAFSQRTDGAGWFNSYASALADPRPDIALIVTPPATHLELTLAALAAGKHVIVEKPAFLDTDAFDTVALAAAAAERTVLVAENYFYKPLAVLLRDLIGAGEIGALRTVQLNALKWQRAAGWRGDPELAGGGPLFEGGIHWINLLANIGPRITALHSYECGSPLTTVSIARFEGGAVGVLSHSWERRSWLHGLQLSRIQGTRGSITFESNGLFVALHGRKRRLFVPGLSDISGYRAMFADFLAALQNGRPAQFTLAGARQDVALIRGSTQPLAHGEMSSWTS